MRILNRNKRTVYYAIYKGIAQEVDENLDYTGELTVSYDDVKALSANVSAARGTSDLEMFGINEQYNRTIATDQMDLGITEASIVWYDLGEVEEYNPEKPYTDGDMAIKDGTIQKYKDFDWVNVPHDHVVVGIAKSLNSVTYAIKKVDVT